MKLHARPLAVLLSLVVYNAGTKVTRRLPQRAIPAAAPAGAINSSARDVAQWGSSSW